MCEREREEPEKDSVEKVLARKKGKENINKRDAGSLPFTLVMERKPRGPFIHRGKNK